MNNTLITQTSYLCSYMIVDHREEYYKCALDVIYMAGTFLGGKAFGIVAESYGRRFSLGCAIFTTLIGTNFGLIRDPW